MSQIKRIKIEFEMPGTPWKTQIFENGQMKTGIENCIFIADAESGEIFYIENLPSEWVRSLIKDSKIKIINPSERH